MLAYEVVNQCREGGFGGKIRTVKGKAWVVDSISNAKLKVRFFWPFSGDYWIIGLDPDYRWAVVGEPSRQYLWILARTPTLDPQRYSALTHLVEISGYDPSRLRLTPQIPS